MVCVGEGVCLRAGAPASSVVDLVAEFPGLSVDLAQLRLTLKPSTSPRGDLSWLTSRGPPCTRPFRAGSKVQRG